MFRFDYTTGTMVSEEDCNNATVPHRSARTITKSGNYGLAEKARQEFAHLALKINPKTGKPEFPPTPGEMSFAKIRRGPPVPTTVTPDPITTPAPSTSGGDGERGGVPVPEAPPVAEPASAPPSIRMEFMNDITAQRKPEPILAENMWSSFEETLQYRVKPSTDLAANAADSVSEHGEGKKAEPESNAATTNLHFSCDAISSTKENLVKKAQKASRKIMQKLKRMGFYAADDQRSSRLSDSSSSDSEDGDDPLQIEREKDKVYDMEYLERDGEFDVPYVDYYFLGADPADEFPDPEEVVEDETGYREQLRQKLGLSSKKDTYLVGCKNMKF